VRANKQHNNTKTKLYVVRLAIGNHNRVLAAMSPLLVLLAFSIAASSAHVVSYDPMIPGCGFPEGPPCYHGSVPSVNCRRSVDPTVCVTTQMKTVALKIVTDTGCLMYRWEWNCTTNTLTQCVGEVW